MFTPETDPVYVVWKHRVGGINGAAGPMHHETDTFLPLLTTGTATLLRGKAGSFTAAHTHQRVHSAREQDILCRPGLARHSRQERRRSSWGEGWAVRHVHCSSVKPSPPRSHTSMYQA